MNTARIVVLTIAPGAGVAACLASGTDSRLLWAAPVAQPKAACPDAGTAKLGDTGK
jgi:hypothetical protein